CLSEAFTLDGNSFLDAMPVRANCWQSHSWEAIPLTVGTLKRIRAASTGRRRPDDADLFEITIGGAVLAGELYPGVTPEDVKAVARVYWRRLIKPAGRKQRRRAVRAVTRPVRQATRGTGAAAKAAALEAAATVQAGGYEPDPNYQPEPINPCAACEGRGAHTLDSRLHATTTVRCPVCHGTGEID